MSLRSILWAIGDVLSVLIMAAGLILMWLSPVLGIFDWIAQWAGRDIVSFIMQPYFLILIASALGIISAVVMRLLPFRRWRLRLGLVGALALYGGLSVTYFIRAARFYEFFGVKDGLADAPVVLFIIGLVAVVAALMLAWCVREQRAKARYGNRKRTAAARSHIDEVRRAREDEETQELIRQANAAAGLDNTGSTMTTNWQHEREAASRSAETSTLSFSWQANVSSADASDDEYNTSVAAMFEGQEPTLPSAGRRTRYVRDPWGNIITAEEYNKRLEEIRGRTLNTHRTASKN
ncbi:MAG: hypothetical protein LBM78_01565 [Clostridiales bacterium]|nr:hypothetical protein [Clostridiales bacterium]